MTFHPPGGGGGEVVGHARVEVTPDLTRFGAELAAGIRQFSAAAAAAGARPLADVEAAARAAAAALNGRATPAVNNLNRSLSAVAKGGIGAFAGNTLSKAFDNITSGATRGQGALGGLGAGFTAAGGAAGAASAGMGTAAAAIGEVIKKAALLEAAFVGVTTVMGVKAAASLETTKISLEGLSATLGTTADIALAKVQEFAAKTPFSFKSTVDSVIQLSAAFRLTLQPALDVLTILGNAAAAAGKGAFEIDRATLALTQIGARGKLSAQDLHQVSSALPNVAEVEVFDRLAKGLGKSAVEVRSLAEQGLIPAGLAINAILETALAVPGALGAMGRQSQTLTGQFSTLKDNVQILLGNAFLPVIKVIEDRFGPLLNASAEDLTRMGKEIGDKLVPVFEDLVPVLIDVAEAFFAFQEILLKILPPIARGVKAIADSIGVVVGFLDRFKDIVGSGLGLAPDALKNLFAGLDSGLQGSAKHTTALTEKFAGLFDQTKVPIFPTLSDQIAESVEQIRTSISDLLTDQAALTAATRRHDKAVTDLADAQTDLTRIQKESAAGELADAADKLADAIDSVTGAVDRQAAAQKALDDLRAPATERELSDAADDLTEAELGVAEATRARDEALRALNRTTGKSINLAGLSLDQLRTTLANARATLATQRTSTDPAVLQENATQAEIDLRQAKGKVLDAQQAQFDLSHKLISNADRILAAEKDIESAKKATVRAQAEQVKATAKLTELQSGDTQHARDLAAAQERVRAAVEGERDAADGVTAAQAKQKDAADHILGVQHGITSEMQEQIKAQAALFNGNAELRRALSQRLLDVIGVKIPSPFSPATRAGLLDQIFNAATDDPARFKQFLRSLGLFVPGAAEGALVTRPGMWQLGEWSRPEVVLPLTKPDRAWELIRQSLPHMAMPLRRSMQDVVAPARPRPTFDLGSVRATATTATAAGLTEAQVFRAVKEALIEVLGGAGLQGSPVNIEVKPHAGMSEAALARKVAREVARQLNGP